MAKTRELHKFTFRLRGHGQDVPAGVYEAETIEKAFKAALKNCKPFSIPGWELFCIESGGAMPAAEFIDGQEKVRR